MANVLLAQIKTRLDGGRLILFAGTVPRTAAEALNLASVHTELVRIGLNGTGSGLTFDTPINGVLSKSPTEVWRGTTAFEGADAAQTTLTPTFYRFCTAGDDGRAVADALTGTRLQGAVGGPSSGAELRLGIAALTAGNEQPVGDFGWRLPQAALGG
ncbi:hypothetical protein [Lysobacter sp. CA199]|uniref:hypothetical protein n=1 Tax=Lysobacter sp. CA199 TaxID=3455608 RepID=UPI003F8D0687